MWLRSFKNRYRHSQLFRHITWVLLIKVLLLTVLWHTVIKPQKQHPSIQSVAKHLLGTPAKSSTILND